MTRTGPVYHQPLMGVTTMHAPAPAPLVRRPWRWPWVSRARYDDLRAACARSQEAWEALLDRERARGDRLEAALVSMQRAGFRVPDPVPEGPPPDSLPAAVVAALDRLPVPVQRDQVRLARQWLADGIAAADVVARLTRGAEE